MTILFCRYFFWRFGPFF